MTSRWFTSPKLYPHETTNCPMCSSLWMVSFVSSWKGQRPLVIGLGLCVYSSVLPWQVCTNHKRGKRLSQHQLERRPQVSRAQLFPHAGFDSPRPTQHTNPRAHSQHCCHGGVGDGTEGWPIKYLSVCCAECRLSRLGKCYVGIKVEAVPDRKAWL